MTVASATSRKSFTGDDATVAFGTSPMVFFDNTDLQVYLVTTATGASVLQTLTTNYTVSGGAGSTGTVTMVTAPASTETLVIVRVLPLTQGDDFVNNDINDAEVLEDRLDKLTMIAQQLDDAADRALRLSAEETPTDALTELPFDRASAYLAFDSSKNPIAAADPSAYPASAFMATVLDDATAGDALTTLGFSTFAKTIIDDATAADARTTLGAVGLTGNETVAGNKTFSGTTTLSGAATFSSTTTIGDAVVSGYTGFKNKIIGGDFTTNPWQRGTSFTGLASGSFGPDRFRINNTSAAVADVLKTADAPTAAEAGIYSAHCLHVDITTADASIAAGDSYAVIHPVEGLNAALFGFGQSGTRYVTLSFWHKHTVTGTYCVSIRNSASDRSYVAEYTQDTTDTWEKATVTLAVDTSGTWLYDNGIGLAVNFTVAAGSTYQTTAGAWAAGNYFATSSQVNGLSSTSNNFKIALVQLEAGQTATSFESRSVGQELALCQRYYYRIKPASGGLFGVGWADTSTTFYVATPFPVVMRSAPTSVEQSGTASNYLIYTTGGFISSSVPTFSPGTTAGAALTVFTTSGMTAGHGGEGYQSAAVSGYLGWSAEI